MGEKSISISNNIGLSGHVKMKLTDTRNGKVVETREFNNLLLDEYLDSYFTNGTALLSDAVFNACYIGTNDIAPDRSDGIPEAEDILASNLSPQNTVPFDHIGHRYYQTLDIDVDIDDNIMRPSWSHDGKYLAIYEMGNIEIHIYDIDATMAGGWEEFVELDWSPMPGYSSAGWSHDDNYLALGGHAATEDIMIVDFAASIVANELVEVSWSPITDVESEELIRCVAWTVDDAYLLTTSSSYLNIYDMADAFDTSTTPTAHYSSNQCWPTAYGPVVSPDGLYYAISGRGGGTIASRGTARLYDAEELMNNGNVALLFETRSELGAQANAVVDTAFSTDGQYFVYGNNDGSQAGELEIVDLPASAATGFEDFIFVDWSPDSYSRPVRTMDISPDNRFLAIGSNGRIDGIDLAESAARNELVYAEFNHQIRPNRYSTRFSWVRWCPDSSQLILADGSDGTNSTDTEYPALSIMRAGNPTVESREMGYTWTFEEGVGTGTINDVVLRSSDFESAEPFDGECVARQLVEPALVKEEYHRLELEWVLEVTNPTKTWSATITGGGLEGEDVVYTVMVGNAGFIDSISSSAAAAYFDMGTRNSLRSFFGAEGTPRVVIGDSNVVQELDQDHIRLGSFIDELHPPYEVSPGTYTPGSYEQTFRVTLDIDEGVGEIGEVLLYSDHNFVGRVTFDPKLDKPNTHRLHLDFKFSIAPNP